MIEKDGPDPELPETKLVPAAHSKDDDATQLGEELEQVAPELPDRIGDYRILGLLGRGGMGVVYEAEHLGLRTLVALKMLHPDLAGAPEVLERFRREAQRAAALRHPGIVSVLDYGQDESGAPFMALELLRGESLQELLEREGPLPVATVVTVVSRVLEALTYAHAEGVIHRDLKAANVFLARGQARQDPAVVKVVDFGIAKATADRERLTRTGAILGSPEMMPPEQVVSAGKVDARADVYAAGALTFQLLTTRPPVSGDTVFEVVSRVARGDIERHPRNLRNDVPIWLDGVVAMALAHEPSQRFQSAEGMRRALVEGVGSSGTTPDRPQKQGNPAFGATTPSPVHPGAAAFGSATMPMPQSGSGSFVAHTPTPTPVSGPASAVSRTPGLVLPVQPVEPRRRRGGFLPWIVLAVVILAAGLAGVVLAGRAGWFRRGSRTVASSPDPGVPQLPPPVATPPTPGLLPPSPTEAAPPTLLPSAPGSPTLLPSAPGGATPGTPPLVPSGSPPSVPPPLVPIPPPAATVSVPGSIDGLWRGDFGLMAFRTIAPGVVRGVYPHDRGTLTGSLSGNQLVGWWCEAPSRAPDADAGEFSMRFAASGMSVDGRWRYGTGGTWREDWNLRRISVEIPPDLAMRLADASSFCAHP